ncbi:MAG TPA: lipid A biosynthesis lauroyl acyltransferase [Xanthomonadaceae bacterium]|nr:lipid A biosynthesis lauroyl acyltransferase [Xanthomonadaceae bacterium]
MNLPQRLLAGGVFASLRLLGLLPLRWLHAGGRGLAVLYRLLRLYEWRIARRNLDLCFAHVPVDERDRLLREALRQSAMTLMEWPRLWTGPPGRALSLVREVHGLGHFEAALAGPAGLIVAAPHLGDWELLNRWLASRTPLSIVYRPPDSRAMEAVLLRARAAPGVTQVRAESGAVRSLFRVLHAGGVVGILPDQQPKRGDGEFAPFFGIEAFTMTLLSRLAQRTGAQVLFAWAERVDAGRAFDIHVLPAPEGIDAADQRVATAALNRGVEACVRQNPAQYLWGYKRFSMRPGDQPGLYRDLDRRPAGC